MGYAGEGGKNMTLREKILKTFIVTMREINKYGGPQEFFKKYPVGGMYYMLRTPKNGENPLTENYETGTYLTREKLKICQEAAGYKMLVCADSAKMVDQTIDVCQRVLGALDEENAYDYGKIIGMQMNAHNIDWVLGPCIDMYFTSAMPLMATTDDPVKCAKIYRQVVKGIQDQGVCATAKHFPGLGTHSMNMHLAPGQNTLSFDEWMKTYGYTYQEVIDEGVWSIMTTHTTLTSFADECENGYYPIATYSTKLTTELLKEKLNFKGAVVTDALIMGGMATGDIVEETVQAFKAGADLLLWPPMEAADRIEELILSGEIPMSRLDDAIERIERMEKFRNEALQKKAFDTPNAEYIDNKFVEMTEKAVCLLRNEVGILPLDKNKVKSVVIIDAARDSDRKSAMLLKEEVEKRGIKADIKRDIFDTISEVCWQDDIEAEIEGYDYVLFNLNKEFACSWDTSCMLIWASHMIKQDKKIIINYGSPYFADDYFPEDKTLIEVNNNPNPTSVAAVAKGIFGEMEFTGEPVINYKK